jgi:TolB-like protein
VLDSIIAFLGELKRRSVYRVTLAYVAVTFIALEAVGVLIPSTSLPNWVDEFLLAIAILGLPIAIVFAWAFEMTPEGVRLTQARETQNPVGASTSVFGFLVTVAIAVGALFFWWNYDSRNSDTQDEIDRTIAVLPFETLGAAQADAFTEGIHLGVMTRLSDVSQLEVISRTSVQAYRNTDKTLPAIAAELGVVWIVRAEVQRIGEQVQVNARLLNATVDRQMWAQDYRRDLSADDIFDIQSDLANAIISELKTRLTPFEQARVNTRPTHNLDAYLAAESAREEGDKLTKESLLRAASLYQQAIDFDPDFAVAWVGLADSLTRMYDYGFDTDRAILSQSSTAIQRALELDPTAAEAFASLGLLQGTESKGPDAIRSLTTAVQLRPNYGTAFSWRAFFELDLGRSAAALESARSAAAVDPMSGEVVSNLALALMANGEFDEALDVVNRLRLLMPDWPTTSFYEALARYHIGEHEEVLRLLEGVTVEWAGRGAESLFALSLIAVGDIETANKQAAELEEEGALFDAALIQAGLGNRVRALELLERITEWGHWPAIATHQFYPQIMDELKNDPRFADIENRIDKY